MFAVVIAFVCFYHAERMLSAIVKFLVHLFGKLRGGLKWERGELEKRVQKEGERAESASFAFVDKKLKQRRT